MSCVHHKEYYVNAFRPFSEISKEDFITAHQEQLAGLTPEELAAYEHRLDVDIYHGAHRSDKSGEDCHRDDPAASGW